MEMGPADSSRHQGAGGEARYRGVRKRAWGRWVSEIRLPNCRDRIWLGSYDSAEKAARAFDAAMYCLRGPKGRFNFPDVIPEIPDGRSLSPSEIQAFAMSFANGNEGRPSASTESPDYLSPVSSDEGTSSTTTTNTTTTTIAACDDGTIDWSFAEPPLAVGNSGFIDGFSLLDEFGNELFVPPTDDNLAAGFGDEGGDGAFDSQHSSLWTF